MAVIQGESSRKAELWQEYRRAFEEFCEKLRCVQSLTSDLRCDQVALETALIELEKARVLYSGRRDALVELILDLEPIMLSADFVTFHAPFSFYTGN